jgi:hypothetical protein
MKRYLLVTLAMFVFAVPVCAQVETETEEVVLPDAVMEQLINRILKWYYTPARTLRTIA